MSNEQQTKQVSTEQSSNKPIEVLRDGALKNAIFKNEKDGKTFFTIEPGRIYTEDGEVKEAKSYSANEALRMSRLMEKSYDRVSEFKAQLKIATKDTNRDR